MLIYINYTKLKCYRICYEQQQQIKKDRHAHFSGGCFHMASERFMCCNMHEEQTHRTVSVAVWGLCMLGMNYVDVFLLVWWQTAASAQQIAPRREHRALTSLTPPAAYRWASARLHGDSHPRNERPMLRTCTKRWYKRVCACLCVRFYFPNAFDWSAN